MNFLLATALPSASSMIGLLVWVAIAAVVLWAIVALVRWSGVPIPQPIWIVLVAFVCIALILLMARVFGLLI